MAITRRTRNAFVGSSRHKGSNPFISAKNGRKPLILLGFRLLLLFELVGGRKGKDGPKKWFDYCCFFQYDTFHNGSGFFPFIFEEIGVDIQGSGWVGVA